MRPKTTLITGACRSGKSRHALELTRPTSDPLFIATALAKDDEMRDRIGQHARERGEHWTTIEEPLFLSKVLEREMNSGRAIVVDCLTFWVTNWLLRVEDRLASESDWQRECEAVLKLMANPRGHLVLVTNEVGWGVVPEYRLGRLFRDWVGRVNQQTAAAAEEVILMVCGIPSPIKSTAD